MRARSYTPAVKPSLPPYVPLVYSRIILHIISSNIRIYGGRICLHSLFESSTSSCPQRRHSTRFGTHTPTNRENKSEYTFTSPSLSNRQLCSRTGNSKQHTLHRSSISETWLDVAKSLRNPYPTEFRRTYRPFFYYTNILTVLLFFYFIHNHTLHISLCVRATNRQAFRQDTRPWSRTE